MAQDLSVKEQLELIVQLSKLDQQIDELYAEFGELPDRIEEVRKAVEEQEEKIEQLQERHKEVIGEKTDVHLKVQALEERQKELEDLLFQVKTNRQYDAIVKELEYLKQQRQDEENKYATLAIQEHNISKQLEQEQQQLEQLKAELQELEEEFAALEGGLDKKIRRLEMKREKLVQKLPKQLLSHYERISEYHGDAAVPLKRGSCSGCYSVVPPQTEVELRNYYRIFFCENCGRILYPEELEEKEAVDS